MLQYFETRLYTTFSKKSLARYLTRSHMLWYIWAKFQCNFTWKNSGHSWYEFLLNQNRLILSFSVVFLCADSRVVLQSSTAGKPQFSRRREGQSGGVAGKLRRFHRMSSQSRRSRNRTETCCSVHIHQRPRCSSRLEWCYHMCWSNGRYWGNEHFTITWKDYLNKL